MPKSRSCLGKFVSPGKPGEGCISRRRWWSISTELSPSRPLAEVRADEAADLVRRAVTLHRSGELAEAVKFYRRALRRSESKEPNLDQTHLIVAMGHALAGQGRLDEAERAMRSAAEHDPNNAVAHANHAVVLRSLGRLDDAERVCRAALAIDTDYIPALHSLGTILSVQRRAAEAEAAFVRVLTLDPRHIQSMINLAALCSMSDRFDEAEALLERAILVAPHSAEAHVNLGILRSDVGQTAGAIFALRKAVEIDPNNVEAWYALSAAGALELGRADAERLVRLADSGRLGEDQRIKLYFVLALAAERHGKMARAFSDFQQGNSLRKASLERVGKGFDPAGHAALIDGLIHDFPVGFAVDAAAPADRGPIFVVGLPRSGTTLIEQILGAHPDARGIGERDDISLLAEAVTACDGPALARTYLDEVMARAKGARMVIDKTPFNFLHLGTIARLLPGARIIHCRRDLHDVGLSCFTQNFVLPHAWSCDLDHIGGYIADYLRLMAHWRATLPAGTMIEVDYEALVADPEAQARRLTDFVGLDWDAACLDFHKAKGIVRSASKWQVRKPIYASSVGRWRAYRQFLGPLLDHLR